jgi:hypothetical protein
MTAILELINAIQTYQSTLEFVSGGKMHEFLAAMGDNQFKSALDALDKAKRANNPSAEVHAAANYLRSAHFAFVDSMNSFSSSMSMRSYDRYRNRAIWSAMLRASCYKRLGEGGLARECVVDAVNAWDKIGIHWKNRIARKSKGLLNPADVAMSLVDSLFSNEARWSLEYDSVSKFWRAIGTNFNGQKTYKDMDFTKEMWA